MLRFMICLSFVVFVCLLAHHKLPIISIEDFSSTKDTCKADSVSPSHLDPSSVRRKIYRDAIYKIESNFRPHARRFEPAVYHRLRKTSKRSAYRDSLLATSFGRPQVMGFNYRIAGFKDVVSFVKAMRDTLVQDTVTARLMRIWKVDSALDKKNYCKAARVWNGPKYRKNHYQQKLHKLLASK